MPWWHQGSTTLA